MQTNISHKLAVTIPSLDWYVNSTLTSPCLVFCRLYSDDVLQAVAYEKREEVQVHYRRGLRVAEANTYLPKHAKRYICIPRSYRNPRSFLWIDVAACCVWDGW